jgi:hypothetical protein
MKRMVLVRILQLLCVFASFVTTAIGFYYALGLDGAQAIAIAALVSFLLQCFIVLTVDEVAEFRLGFRWMLALAFYFVAFTVSSIFSIAFYFGLFSARDFAAQEFQDVQIQVLQEAEKVRAEMQVLGDAFEGWAVYAATQRDIEETKGGTCVGSPGRGEGPYVFKRRYESARASTYAEDYRGRMTRVSSAIDDLRKVPAAAGVIGFAPSWARVRTALDGATIQSTLKPWIKHEMKGFPNKPIYSAFSGPEHACGDPKSAALVQDIVQRPLPTLPEIRFDQLDPESPKEIVFLVANDAMDFLSGTKTDDLRITRRDFWPSILFGVLVDLAIFFLGLILVAGRRSFNSSVEAKLIDWAEDMVENIPDFDPDWHPVDDMSDVHRVYQIVERHFVFEDNGRPYLVVPKAPALRDVANGPALEALGRPLISTSRRLRWIKRRPLKKLPKGLSMEVLETRFPGLLVSTPDRWANVVSIYEFFADVERLQSTAKGGAISRYESLDVDEFLPPLRPSRRSSRFFHACMRTHDRLVARKMMQALRPLPNDPALSQIPLHTLKMPPSVVRRWREVNRWQIDHDFLGRELVLVSNEDMDELQRMAEYPARRDNAVEVIQHTSLRSGRTLAPGQVG